MSWNYNPDQESPRDRLRFMIGDTDTDRQLLMDEELEAVYTRQSNDLISAAIELADHLEAKFVHRAESRSGDIIADFLTVAGKYRELANRLRKRRSQGKSLLSRAEKCADKQNTTFDPPQISLNDFDYPGTF